MAKVPATPLSIEYMTKNDCRVAIVERFIPKKPFPIKQDMFGLFDLVAVRIVGDQVYFIQTTSKVNLSSRRARMLAQPELLRSLLDANIKCQLHGWSKIGASYELICEQARREEDGSISMNRHSVESMKELRARVRRMQCKTS
jgi:hypothetical protein